MTWLSNERKYPRGYWTIKENVINEAKKYNSKEEFQNKNISAFLAAHRYGFIKEMDWLVKQKQHAKNYWNVERIKEEATKYDTKTEFANKNRAAYNASRKLDIINTEIDRLTNNSNNFDYAVAIGSGVLTGLIDAFRVGEFNFEEYII